MRGDGRIYKRRGSNHWWIAYNHQGKELRESSTSTEYRDAQKLLKRRLQEIGADTLGLQSFLGPSQDRITVGDLLDHLEHDYRIRSKYSPSIKSHLQRARDAFGHYRAILLTPKHVDSFIEAELDSGRAPATINRCTQLVGQAYNLALRRKELNTKPYIRKLPERNARQGFFEHDEYERVITHLPEYLKDACRFAYLSGWRRGEVFTLEWTDVDQRARVIRLRPEESKNGQGRTLALEGDLWTIIERRWSQRTVTRNNKTAVISRYVFHHDGHAIIDIKKAWAKACTAAGVGPRLFHDFRRTAIRNMVRAGVPETVAMKISGHKTRSVFDRYNITDERDLREAMQKTQDYLASFK
jgi:integrase